MKDKLCVEVSGMFSRLTKCNDDAKGQMREYSDNCSKIFPLQNVFIVMSIPGTWYKAPMKMIQRNIE